MGAKKVLIADDEALMRKLVGDFLRKEGYQVFEAADGKQALDLFFNEKEIVLLILDIMMPEYDGWAVCREIRKTSQVPIIMLTARSEEADELFGFDLGADEYITKPFSPHILVARVQALLRRIENRKNAVIRVGKLEIDNGRHYVSINGKGLDLSPKEYELLLYMVENEGITLSRDQILNAVWNYNYYGDVRTVDTHVKKLRLKLGDKANYIQTIRGFGYRLEVNND